VLTLTVCLLNVLNPQLPALQCQQQPAGQPPPPTSRTTIIDDPRISHKFTGDTVTTSKLLFAVVFLPLLQVQNPYINLITMH
jgi:hypothetical protein